MFSRLSVWPTEQIYISGGGWAGGEQMVSNRQKSCVKTKWRVNSGGMKNGSKPGERSLVCSSVYFRHWEKISFFLFISTKREKKSFYLSSLHKWPAAREFSSFLCCSIDLLLSSSVRASLVLYLKRDNTKELCEIHTFLHIAFWYRWYWADAE